MRRHPLPRGQSRAVAAKVPGPALLWILVALTLALFAACNRVGSAPLDGRAPYAVQNAPAVVQSLIEKYAPR